MKNYLIWILVVTTVFTSGILYYDSTRPAQQQVAPIPIQPSPIVPKEWTFEEASNLINVQDATAWLTYLASDELEGRMSGKKGNKVAAQWAKEKFESFGLKTEYQQFQIRRMNNGPKNETGDDFTNNIIATMTGETDRVIVIGAHIDHVGWGPSMSTDGIVGIHNGADDNGSGTVGVLLTAKAMSKLPKMKHTIKFILFSGEEMGLIGSRHYVSKLTREELGKIDLMINYDMIGRFKPNGFVECVGARKSPNLTKLIMELESKYGLKMLPKTGDGEGNSDHAPFYDKGIPVCFFFTGMHPQYHKVSDDVNLINFDGLTLIAKIGMDLVYQWDKK